MKPRLWRLPSPPFIANRALQFSSCSCRADTLGTRKQHGRSGGEDTAATATTWASAKSAIATLARRDKEQSGAWQGPAESIEEKRVITFLVRRSIALVAVLFCVVTITFFLIRLSPGGPFDAERKIPPAIEKQLLAKYKLDGPLWQQYAGYLGDLMRGDLRDSTKYRNRSVAEILAQTLPVTMTLGAFAFTLAVVGGTFFGVAAAAGHGTWKDTFAMLLALAAISLPAFITGPVLILIFSFWLHWLPVGGWSGPSAVILPAVTLAAPYVAYIARLLRGSMMETLGQDFIRTARAKGLAERIVLYRHALRVAILPVVSFLGPLAAHLLTGSIVVETIFYIPGAGGFFVNSILNRDGFLLGGVVIVYCTMLVLFNLAVDVIYTFLDRRIRLDA